MDDKWWDTDTHLLGYTDLKIPRDGMKFDNQKCGVCKQMNGVLLIGNTKNTQYAEFRCPWCFNRYTYVEPGTPPFFRNQRIAFAKRAVEFRPEQKKLDEK